MGREAIPTGGSGARAWSDGDKFVALLLNRHVEKIKGDDAPILTFLSDKGEQVERWSTSLWDRLILKDKAIRLGDVLDVEALKEVKAKKGRFRPFAIARLTGSSIPKPLRGVKR